MVDTPYRESALGAQVHQRIREQLKKRDADEDQLISAIAWPKSRYQKMFIGHRGPTLETLAVFAAAIGCDIADLVVGVNAAPERGGA